MEITNIFYILTKQNWLLIFAIPAFIVNLITLTQFLISNFPPVSRKRKKVLKGKWTGSVTQTNKAKKEYVTSNLELNITNISLQKVKGSIVVRDIEPFKTDQQLKIKGSFSSERFLKITYSNLDDPSIRFGYGILRLTDDAKYLKGCFIGFGPKSEKVISTMELSLEKKG